MPASFLDRGGGNHLLHRVGKVVIFPREIRPHTGDWKKYWEEEILSSEYSFTLILKIDSSWLTASIGKVLGRLLLIVVKNAGT